MSYEETSTLQLPFKITYSMFASEALSTSRKRSQRVVTKNNSESVDVINEISASSDTLLSPQHEQVKIENEKLKEESKEMKMKIYNLEALIRVLKLFDQKHTNVILNHDKLEKEVENLKVIIIDLKSESKSNEIQYQSFAKTSFTEKNELTRTVSSLKSRISKLKKLHCSDKRKIHELTMLSKIENFECENEQHKFLGLQLQASEAEKETTKIKMCGLQSEIRFHWSRGRNHEKEKENMNITIRDQNTRISQLMEIIQDKRFGMRSFSGIEWE